MPNGFKRDFLYGCQVIAKSDDNEEKKEEEKVWIRVSSSQVK